jgi:hypothetical protein
MTIQVFTRYSGSGTAKASKPRRLCTMQTTAEAIKFCTARNEARSSDQRRKGMFYEWTTMDYFREAWGR